MSGQQPDSIENTTGPLGAEIVEHYAPEPGSPPITPELLRFPLSEAGAANRLIARWGENMRFVSQWRAWICWDAAAGRWRRDLDGQAERWALESLRAARAACRVHQGAAMATGEVPAKIEAALLKLETDRKIAGILSLARVQCGITVQAQDLDADRYLLKPAGRGTYDLRRGELREDRRGDLITMAAGFAFDPAAQCPQWERFLKTWMGDTDDATEAERARAVEGIAFLHRAAGLSASGDVTDKATFCLFGPTNSGKTTFLEALRCVLGDYATQIRIDSLLANGRQSDGNQQSDLAGLMGRRFATTSEAEAGQRLSEATIKYLSQGGETKIKCARKYENQVEFPAVHKLWMDSNDRPNVKATDDSSWKRLRPIRFPRRVPDHAIDKTLGAKLRAEGPGILNWLLEGFKLWQAEGLGDPVGVQEAREEWKAECDSLRLFVEECCELRPDDPDCWAPAGELFARYEEWAKDSGERFPLGRRSFAERLKALGCVNANKRSDSNGHRLRSWEGIEIAAS